MFFTRFDWDFHTNLGSVTYTIWQIHETNIYGHLQQILLHRLKHRSNWKSIALLSHGIWSLGSTPINMSMVSLCTFYPSAKVEWLSNTRFSMPAQLVQVLWIDRYCGSSVSWHIDIVSVESDSGYIGFEYFFTMTYWFARNAGRSQGTLGLYGTKFLVSDESLKVLSSHGMVYVTNCTTRTRVNFQPDYKSKPMTRTLKPSI